MIIEVGVPKGYIGHYNGKSVSKSTENDKNRLF